MKVEIIGVKGIPEVHQGSELAKLIIDSIERMGMKLQDGDIIVVTQKIVSKAEGRLIRIDDITPSKFAIRIGKLLKKDPRLVEVILNESKRIVKMARGVIIVETKHGFVCANGGVDQSNIPKGFVSLLPVNPDRSAKRIRDTIKRLLGVDVAVIISDTFGRPWREGHVDVAIGVAGLKPFIDYRGQKDTFGYELRVTMMAIADELASAAELVMGKLNNVPVAIIRGYPYPKGEGSARELVRRASKDLFR
ncbi:MAG: coenzyme F420-0:L-glutamate ligase [Nitrososphaerota archaeon]|nr:coenzyme F420-0:L-glutamate ligase [Nitrososphaerales archaeon]MCX8191807.1 coenzyme F420-0:L-glutamate ligase [Nitrososphaerales archaeon]MDW8044614.1 coenzyme F420-0:L-glutamate ligase [Nitrososphaerota archaeon]